MIIPAGHRVLVKPDSLKNSEALKTKERATDSGIVLPDFVDKELEDEALREQAGIDQGTVVSLGSTAFRDFGDIPWCKAGDYIAFARHAGKWITDPDTEEKMLIINDEDVVCIINKKDA